MKRIRTAKRWALVFVTGALLVFGCSDDSTAPKVQKPRYPETTDKEGVINNLLTSYKDCNIAEFSKLLHEDYVWYIPARDVQDGLPEYYTRAEEIAITNSMFAARLGMHPDPDLRLDKLSLSIDGNAPWMQIADFEGNPCTDCWETTREYQLMLVLSGGAMTLIANDLVQLTVVPVSVSGRNLYRLIRADDIEKP